MPSLKFWKRTAVTGLAAVLLLPGGAADAGRMRLAANGDTDGGIYVNIIVREVRVSPVRARIGDPVRIDMIVENQGEGGGTVTAAVYANGREVAGHLYTFGFSGEGGRITRETFTWDTRGMAPGEYRIRGEVFVWGDASEFDNDLTVPEPVVLLPPDAAEGPGGSATVRDPRFRPAPSAEGPEAPSKQ